MARYNVTVSKEEVDEYEFSGKLSNAFKSKVGQKFGKLTVYKLAGKDSKNLLQYFCQCDCGTFVVRKAHQLKPTTNKYLFSSCGCCYNKDKKISLEEMIDMGC